MGLGAGLEPAQPWTHAVRSLLGSSPEERIPCVSRSQSRGLLRKYNQDNANSVPTKRLATLTSRNQANRGLTSCGSARHGYCFLLFSACLEVQSVLQEDDS